MKEKVLEAFRELGFLLEQSEELGWYNFNYEGMTLVYIPNDDDENFLSISIPRICDWEEDNTAKIVALTEKINSAAKYVKAYNLSESVWLFYERELMGDEDLQLVISRMISYLEVASLLARKFLTTLDSDEEAEDADESREEDESMYDAEVEEETEN